MLLIVDFIIVFIMDGLCDMDPLDTDIVKPPTPTTKEQNTKSGRDTKRL